MSAVAPPRPEADADAGVGAGVGVGAPGGDVPSGAAPEQGWWAGAGPVTRAVVVVLGLVVGVNLGLSVLGSVVGRDPGGPAGSSLATADNGVAAWSDLLRARGVEVEALRTPLGEADLPPGGTVVVVDPEAPPTPEGTRALAAHLEGGGRVVLVGGAGADQLTALTGIDPLWTRDSDVAVEVVPGAPGLAGVSAVSGEGRGAFVDTGPLEVLAVGAESGVAAVAAAGGLVVVADPSPLWNRHLGEADNAALAVALVGDGPVAFAEAEHGYGDATGLAALPTRWRVTAAALLVVALLGMWSVGQRLGPPEHADRRLAPPRGAYVDAVAAALSRSRRRGVDAPSPGPAPDRPPERQAAPDRRSP